MKWVEGFYRINFHDGTSKKVFGLCRDLFGCASGVLSHLKTGYLIARFVDDESAMRVGDYLALKYADEFALLHKQYRQPITHEQYKLLPSAIDLNAKINADACFLRELKTFGVKEEEKDSTDE